jgi:hypothetical protein
MAFSRWRGTLASAGQLHQHALFFGSAVPVKPNGSTTEAARCQHRVNLGRVKLADSLGLMLPKTLEEEKEMWGLVTKYAYYASPEYGEPLNAYRKKIAVDDALAFRDAFQDRYEAAVAGAQGNETLVHLISFADDVDVFAKLT